MYFATRPQSQRTSGAAFRAIYLLFGFEGASFAALLPRFPDLQQSIGLGPADFGLALTGIPAGLLAGLLVAPVVSAGLGPERAARASVLALAWVVVLPGLVNSQPALFVSFLAVGLGASHTEIGLNAFAAKAEAATGRRIMSTCHGVWGIGAILGTALGGAFAEKAMPLFLQSLLVAVLVSAGVMSLRLVPFLPPAPRSRARLALPSRQLLSLCFLPVGIMIVEGIFMDWSNLQLRLAAGASPFVASLGYAAFALFMSIVRLFGDALARRFGDRTVVVWSSLAAGCGTLVFAFATNPGLALSGAAICGAGTALVYPITLSVAARLPGSPERNIATVSMTSFLILSASPAAFGFMAQHVGLRASIAWCAALVVPGVFLARSLRRAGPQAAHHSPLA